MKEIPGEPIVVDNVPTDPKGFAGRLVKAAKKVTGHGDKADDSTDHAVRIKKGKKPDALSDPDSLWIG
jgi:hypothetical protein